MDALRTLNIEPIKLLKGSHKDTDTTGSGCFMNVIAYLNGEAQITDKSPCVCPVIRPTMIFMNDYLPPARRQKMLDFIPRAMGSVANDLETVFDRSVKLLEMLYETIVMARDCAEYFHTKYHLLDTKNNRETRYINVIHEAHRQIEEFAHQMRYRSANDAALVATIAVRVPAIMSALLSVPWRHDRFALCPVYRMREMSVTMMEPTFTTQYVSLEEQASELLFRMADKLLPPADVPTQITIDRAKDLVKIYEKHTAHALS